MFCQCGCGQETKEGNVYLHGHNSRVDNNFKCLTKESRALIGLALKGKPRPAFSDEWKQHLSLAHIGHTRSKESRLNQSKTCFGKTHPHKSHTHTDVSKQKIREAHLGMKASFETKQKISKAHIGMDATWMRGEKHPNWQGGSSFFPYCTKFNMKLKECVRERDNRTCQLCGIPENGRKHHVHHIHYDKDNCYPDLVCLCVCCNTKVNYNRPYYERYFMNLLNIRSLLFWTKEVIK